MSERKEQVFSLWRQTNKDGTKRYLSGSDSFGRKLIGFYNQESPNLKIYEKPKSEADKIDYNNPIGMLDVTTSQNGNKYLRGTYSGVAVSMFINKDKKNEKSPDFTAYPASTNGSTQITFESDDALPF